MATINQVLKEVGEQHELSSDQLKTLPTAESIITAFRDCSEECSQYARLALQESINCTSTADKEPTAVKQEKKFKLGEDYAARASRFTTEMHKSLERARQIKEGSEEGQKHYREVLTAVVHARRGEPVAKEYQNLLVRFSQLDPL